MSRNVARAIMVVLIGIIIASLVIAPAALGSTLKLTGTLWSSPDAADRPSPTAVAVVTLIDATNTSDAGNIIGQQRIDGIGDGTITFAVPYDSAAVQPTHAYALFATVVDGTSTWQNPKGVPVITGGPTEAVRSRSRRVVAGPPTITGRLPLPDRRPPTAAAVSIAALIKQETGHARQPPGPPDAQRQPAVLLRLLRPDPHRSGRDLRRSSARSSTARPSGRARPACPPSSVARPPGRSTCRSS